MNNEYDDGHGDILRHLRNTNNPYIHPNTIANLPNANNNNNNNNHNSNRQRRNKRNGPANRAAPSTIRITKPLEIVLLNGKTRTERTRGTTISCDMDAYSVMVTLKDILRCEKILTSLDHFIFGYCITEKGKFQSIYDYKINHIDFKKKFHHFILQQVSETPTEPTTTTSTTKTNNKRLYEERNNAMIEAEVTLRKELDFEDFKTLRKNRKIFAKYKYDMGVLGRTFEDVEEELYQDLDEFKDKQKGGRRRGRKRRKVESESESDGEYGRRRKRQRRSSPSPSRDNKENNPMDDMLNIMKMKMMMECVMNTSTTASVLPPSVLPPLPTTTAIPPPVLPPLPAPATEPRQIASNLRDLTRDLLQRRYKR